MTEMKPIAFAALMAAAVMATALSTGCSLAPNYQRPDLPVPLAWPVGAAYQTAPPPNAHGADPAETIGWREFFTDPRLRALIEISLRNNRDLRIATLNVAGAEARYRVQRANLFPLLTATGADTIERMPDNGSGSAGPPGTSRIYSVNAGFTAYELDLFGRVRNLSRQAFEQYLGYAESRRSAQISLVAEVANAYLTLLADRELLHITQQTLTNQTAAYQLIKATFDGGSATALALRQAETSVDTARANLALYTRQLAQDENALALLLGQSVPADLPKGLGLIGQGLLENLPVGLPSDLLVKRPDIIAAEHNLLAANANIGAARAAFFPSISLTASGGLMSASLGTLFAGTAATWAFNPQVTIPIFAAGQNEGNLDLAKAQKNVFVAQYEKAIQTAFREVADCLAARGTWLNQLAAQQALVDASADSYRLSYMRFRAGVDNYLPTLDSQRALYSGQQSLIALKQAELANLITLYKALGGGWNEHTVSAGFED
jgi:multidrug efflux system outer membrane protein